MEFEDIKIFQNQIYMLRTLTLKSSDVEQAVKSFNYQKYYNTYKQIDTMVEKASLPKFVASFYTYLFLYRTIPSPETFIQLYFANNTAYIKTISDTTVEVNGKQLSREGIIGRALRAYPSLIREYYFYLLLTEDNKFDKVTYSFKDDINGVDIKADYKGVTYNISVLDNTRNSIKWKQEKNTVRHKYTNEIQVKMDLNHRIVCGDIYLFTKDYLIPVYKEAGIIKEGNGTIYENQ